MSAPEPHNDVARLDFAQLVDAHYAPLYRFGLSLARNEMEAADLTQQTFYIWAEKGANLRDAGKVKSWLFTTLYREFLAGRRHDTRFPKVALDDAGELPAVTQSLDQKIDGAAAMDALRALDEIYRAPLALFYLKQFSYIEIAEILEVPIGTVMSRLSRGKAQLRQALCERQSNTERRVVDMPATFSRREHE